MREAIMTLLEDSGIRFRNIITGKIKSNWIKTDLDLK